MHKAPPLPPLEPIQSQSWHNETQDCVEDGRIQGYPHAQQVQRDVDAQREREGGSQEAHGHGARQRRKPRSDGFGDQRGVERGSQRAQGRQGEGTLLHPRFGDKKRGQARQQEQDKDCKKEMTRAAVSNQSVASIRRARLH